MSGEHLLLSGGLMPLKEGSTVVRTRTIREAAAYFRECDPQTCLTETAIRTLLRTGSVPSVRVGKKYLVTVEALEAYLTGETGPAAASVPPKSRKWRIK